VAQPHEVHHRSFGIVDPDVFTGSCLYGGESEFEGSCGEAKHLGRRVADVRRAMRAWNGDLYCGRDLVGEVVDD
jgi:hypothetical protein